MSKEKASHNTSVGGQALMEGVMMNGPKGAAISVRHVSGEIITEAFETKHVKDKFKPLGLPFIRGIVNFIESMMVGYKSLMRSVELSGMLNEEDDKENMSKLDRWLSDHLGPKLFNILTVISSVIVAAICIVLFFYGPTFIVDMIYKYVVSAFVEDTAVIDNFQPLFEGIIKMAIVTVYMLVVSRMKEIKRVFMYHGAEHKSIFCYEKGLELNVENVRTCKRFHPRCGTSFIFVVLITSVIVSSLTVLIFPELNNPEYRLIWTAIKMLAILPVVTGISYEFIKYAGRHDNIITRIFSAPGLLMQRITTKEPTDDMIEVAIASIKAVVTDCPEDNKTE